jgi:hypothetical protein
MEEKSRGGWEKQGQRMEALWQEMGIPSAEPVGWEAYGQRMEALYQEMGIPPAGPVVEEGEGEDWWERVFAELGAPSPTGRPGVVPSVPRPGGPAAEALGRFLGQQVQALASARPPGGLFTDIIETQAKRWEAQRIEAKTQQAELTKARTKTFEEMFTGLMTEAHTFKLSATAAKVYEATLKDLNVVQWGFVAALIATNQAQQQTWKGAEALGVGSAEAISALNALSRRGPIGAGEGDLSRESKKQTDTQKDMRNLLRRMVGLLGLESTPFL